MAKKPTVTERLDKLERLMEQFLQAQTSTTDRRIQRAANIAYLVGITISVLIPALWAGMTWFWPLLKRGLQHVHILHGG